MYYAGSSLWMDGKRIHTRDSIYLPNFQRYFTYRLIDSKLFECCIKKPGDFCWVSNVAIVACIFIMRNSLFLVFLNITRVFILNTYQHQQEESKFEMNVGSLAIMIRLMMMWFAFCWFFLAWQFFLY